MLFENKQLLSVRFASQCKRNPQNNTLTQCWTNVGPPFPTSAQYWPSIGSMHRVCCEVNVQATCKLVVVGSVLMYNTDSATKQQLGGHSHGIGQSSRREMYLTNSRGSIRKTITSNHPNIRRFRRFLIKFCSFFRKVPLCMWMWFSRDN